MSCVRELSITIIAPNCTVVTISETEFNDATWNAAYTQTLTPVGGTGPYTWTLVSGTLPDGMSFDASGTLSGTPTNFGDFALTVKVEDSVGNVCQQELPLHVSLGADVWLKADSAMSIPGLVNGQSVDTWFDISGNNYHFQIAPLSGDVAPIYTTGLLNGKPGVDFDNLAGLANQTYFKTIGNDITVFIVLQSHSNVNIGRRALNVGGNGGENWLVGPYQGFWKFYNGAFVVGPAIDLDPHYAYVTQTGAGLGTFVFDGVSIGANMAANFTGWQGNPGLGYTYIMENFNGYIYEVIWFGRILTGPEITFVTNYLKSEWGFP